MKCVKDSTPKELPKGLDTIYTKTEVMHKTIQSR